MECRHKHDAHLRRLDLFVSFSFLFIYLQHHHLLSSVLSIFQCSNELFWGRYDLKYKMSLGNVIPPFGNRIYNCVMKQVDAKNRMKYFMMCL